MTGFCGCGDFEVAVLGCSASPGRNWYTPGPTVSSPWRPRAGGICAGSAGTLRAPRYQARGGLAREESMLAVAGTLRAPRDQARGGLTREGG